MSIINQLAGAQGHRDDALNIQLAADIASAGRTDAIAELVENLYHPDKNVQSDCIKVLYETGYLAPELLVPHWEAFTGLLTSRNNRMVWGAMIALSCIAPHCHALLFGALHIIISAMEKGSVITMDAGVSVLAVLSSYPEYYDTTFPHLSGQLLHCPIKQLPAYIEKSLVCITARNKDIMLSIIRNRQPECERASQRQRLDKLAGKIDRITA